MAWQEHGHEPTSARQPTLWAVSDMHTGHVGNKPVAESLYPSSPDDWLIVCGAEGERKRPDGCWYDLIRAPLEPFLVEEADGAEKVLRYRKIEVAPTPAAADSGAKEQKEPRHRELPSWLHEPAPPEAPRASAIASQRPYAAAWARPSVGRHRALA